ncbi:MAG: hypothetical protein RI973_1068 [Bacteroidota bacterium]|jgi:hypothetical protein
MKNIEYGIIAVAALDMFHLILCTSKIKSNISDCQDCIIE